VFGEIPFSNWATSWLTSIGYEAVTPELPLKMRRSWFNTAFHDFFALYDLDRLTVGLV